MSRPLVEGVSLPQLVAVLKEHWRLWLVPMVAAAMLAALATVVLPRHWKATQGLLIRPEAAGLGQQPLGKFSDLSEMKTVQETLLELARSRRVVTRVLREVGPPATRSKAKAWPTDQDIEDFRDAMVMTPPGGAEFGKTEVFYLGVLATDPKRAAALTRSLSKAVEERAQEIRQAQADSMTAELAQSVAQAEADLNARIEELSAFEGSVGAGLNDLRTLLNPIGGVSETSQNILAMQAELRSTERDRRQSEKLLATLRKAKKDPKTLIATPNSLLEAQPALARLKEGLVEAQLATATLLGNLAADHPFVVAAQEAESQVQQRLRQELDTAIEGLEIQLALGADRSAGLKRQIAEHRQSQQHLAGHRASYARLVAAVENQTEVVDAAHTKLANAEGQQAGARSSSVLARIDDVESGLRPVGPSRKTVVAAGGLFGLLLGLGCVFWLHGPTATTAAELDVTPLTDTVEPSPVNQPSFGFAEPAPRRATLSEAIAAGMSSRRNGRLI